MIQPDILSFFRQMIDEPVNRLVREAQTSGRRAIGYTCMVVPEPLLSVDGMVPVRMRAPGIKGTPRADGYLSSVNCSYTRSLLELLMEDRTAGLEGFVFTAGCDHLRRLYDNLDYLKKPSFNYIVDLPHKLGNAALGWYRDELENLAEALASHFNVDTSDAKIAKAIAYQNDYIKVIRSISALQKRTNPPVTGTELHTVVAACAASPKDMIMGRLLELRDRLEALKGIKDYRARLLIVGSRMDSPDCTGIIESVGGLVVADMCCPGSIHATEPIAVLPEASAIETLAAHTLRATSCPRMMEEFDSRVKDILNRAQEYRVDGIIVESMKFCDIWGVESSALVSCLRDAGAAVLKIEQEYALSGEEQLRTRIQAFLESMGK